VLEDIATIYQALDNNPTHPIWQSYIGFLVEREPTSQIISDTLYEGIGGWSPNILFRWRLSRSNLIHTSFHMKYLKRNAWELDIGEPGTHINVLEFVAIIINLWLMIVVSRRRPARIDRHIFAVFTDNTSALSWLCYASHSHHPNVRRLARFTSALLFASGFQGKVQDPHLVGCLNHRAARRPIPLSALPNLGLRYGAMFPTIKMHHISAPAPASFTAWLDDF
jgi:hypothetical protein